MKAQSKIKNVLTKIGLGIAILIAVNVLYFLFMSMCFMVPAEKVKPNIEMSLYTWDKETQFPFFDSGRAMWLDFGSDMIWANIALTDVENPFKAAIELPYATGGEANSKVSFNDLVQGLYYTESEDFVTTTYPRYWMLMVGIIRVLFCFCEISEMRYAFYFLAAILLWSVFRELEKRWGWRGSFPFFMAVVLRVLLLHSISISTSADVFIALGAMLFVLKNAEKDFYKKYQGIFFLVLGSLAFALGPFVAPVLTLGLPLVTNIMLQQERDRDFMSWWRVFTNSTAWVCGYGGSMVIKAILSKMVMGNQSTSSSIAHYLGIGQGIGARFGRIVYCFENLLTPLKIKVPIVLLVLSVLIIMLLTRKRQKVEFKWLLLFVAMYPLLWAFVIVEHTIHYFASNMYSVFVFAILSIITFTIGEKEKL